MSEVFTCSRSGWTKRTSVTRLHPDDLRTLIEQSFAEGYQMTPDEIDGYVRDGFTLGGGSHGDLRWIPDPSLAVGASEEVEVFE